MNSLIRRATVLAGIGILVMLGSGCTDPNEARRAQLSTELGHVQSQFALAQQEVEAQRRRIATLNQEVAALETDLGSLERNVNAYLMKHKLAVAAILAGMGGSAVAFDDTNEYSDEVKGVTGVVVVSLDEPKARYRTAAQASYREIVGAGLPRVRDYARAGRRSAPGQTADAATFDFYEQLPP